MDIWEDLDNRVKAILVIAILAFIAVALYLALYRTFAVPFEDARRDAYEHSQSYVQGAVRDLGNLCLEVSKADSAHKDLLNDTIRERYVKLDERDVPAYLQPCLRTARES